MKYFLTILVFVGGMTSLALEMSASRLLGAYFGTSLYIWGCLIGMLLIYLTVGNFICGQLADRSPSEQVLCILTTIAAISLFAMPFVCKPILSWSINAMAQISVRTLLSSLIGTILLFAIPITLLGLISPFAIRLMTKDIGNSGRISGSLYAILTTRELILNKRQATHSIYYPNQNQILTGWYWDDFLTAPYFHEGMQANTAHTAHDYHLVQAFVNTMKQVFPSVYTFNVPNSINTEIMATKEPTSITTFQQNLARFSPTSTLGQVTNEVLPVVQEGHADGGLVFTDDRSPIEQISCCWTIFSNRADKFMNSRLQRERRIQSSVSVT